MDIFDIVREYLTKNGFDGLVEGSEGLCSCHIDDLFPCGGEDIGDCEPGYKTECPGEELCHGGGGCAFHISTEKQ